MGNKLMLNISDSPTWSKALPVVGLIAGIGLAKYQNKDCIGCYLGYSLSGMLLLSVPLLIESKKAAQKVSEDCGCGG